MDFKKRYVFSKETERRLLDFYKNTKENNGKNDDDNQKANDKRELWKHFLPQNDSLINELEQAIIDEQKIPVINLTIEETDSSISLNEKGIISLTEQENEISIIKGEQRDRQSVIEDFVFAIKECLENEEEVAKVIFSSMMEHCDLQQMENVFLELSKFLDSSQINIFGKSLLKHDQNINNNITSLYIKHLLFPKIQQERNDQLTEIFQLFFEVSSSITSFELITTIITINEVPKPLIENLTMLEKQNKDALLRSFLLNIRRLETTHFNLIEALLTPPISRDIVAILIEALHAVSSNFNTDKNFGKLLITIIKTCGKNLGYHELEIKHIVENHRSIWKNQAKKLLEGLQESFGSLSQSFTN